jgi:hypothetical protein
MELLSFYEISLNNSTEFERKLLQKKKQSQSL